MSELSRVLEGLVERRRAPGIIVLVARGDEVVVEVAGERALGGPPMTRDTIVRAASITKPITAALTMVLVEEGLLSLDGAAGDLLPEVAAPRVLRTPDAALDDTIACSRPVTTRDLLTFQSGLGFTTDFETPFCRALSEVLDQGPPHPQAIPDPDAWMALVAGLPLVHQPGDGWTYNTSSDVLGVLLSRAAGMPLGDLLHDRILGPLGMVDTGFSVPAGSLDRFATYYTNDEDGELVVADPPDGEWSSPPRFPSGAGGLVTTVDDWLAFGRMILGRGAHAGGRLLTPDSVDLMLTDTTTPAMRDGAGFFLEGQGWGFGGSVDIETTQAWNSVGRYGWIGGTSTAAYVDPAAGTVTVMLAQVQVGGPGTDDLLGGSLTAAATVFPPKR